MRKINEILIFLMISYSGARFFYMYKVHLIIFKFHIQIFNFNVKFTQLLNVVTQFLKHGIKLNIITPLSYVLSLNV